MANLLLLNVGGVASGSLLNQLVAYWKLDEASGSRADSHGANTLTDNNTVTQATGKLTNAAQFTAANSEYLSITDNAALSLGDIDFSLAGWLYLDSLGAVVCVGGKGDANASETVEWYLVVAADNRPGWVVANGAAFGQVGHSSVLASGTWYWFYAYHDAAANELGLSIDNAAAETASYAGGSQDTAHPLNLGRYPVLGSNYFDGRLDGVALWKRLLTADERTQLYNGGSGLDYPFV